MQNLLCSAAGLRFQRHRLVHYLALQLTDELPIVRIYAHSTGILKVARQRFANRCGRIAAAGEQTTLTACFGNAMRDASRRDGVHEGALAITSGVGRKKTMVSYIWDIIRPSVLSQFFLMITK